MKVIKGITILAIYSILIVIILINVSSIKGTSFLGFQAFRIASGSMEPTLKVNDFIVIKKQNEYKVNDVITYLGENNEHITHRIIEINESEIITKGDANNIQDINPVRKEQILGKLKFRIQVVDFITFLIENKIVWIILFFIGLILIIVIPIKVKPKHMK